MTHSPGWAVLGRIFEAACKKYFDVLVMLDPTDPEDRKKVDPAQMCSFLANDISKEIRDSVQHHVDTALNHQVESKAVEKDPPRLRFKVPNAPTAKQSK